MEAYLYRLREGYRWRALPHDFPGWSTVADPLRRWKKRKGCALIAFCWRVERTFA